MNGQYLFFHGNYLSPFPHTYPVYRENISYSQGLFSTLGWGRDGEWGQYTNCPPQNNSWLTTLLLKVGYGWVIPFHIHQCGSLIIHAVIFGQSQGSGALNLLKIMDRTIAGSSFLEIRYTKHVCTTKIKNVRHEF